MGYYSGSGEAKPDAAYVVARRRKEADAFDPLEVVADTPGKPEGNGILFETGGGLRLVYNTMHGKLDGPPGPGIRWVTCDMRMKRSSDSGSTWTEVQMIDEKWGNVVRCKPIRLRSGELIFGTEYDDGESRVWSSGDKGESWEVVGRISGERNQHPSFTERIDGSILALLRPTGGQKRVLRSISSDGGRTWAPAVTTELESPFAALDSVRLGDGRVVIAWNDNPDQRNPLTLAISEDEGETWACRRNLVAGEGKFDYPAMIQTADGLLHVTFSNNRSSIDHIVVEPEWIEGVRREAGKAVCSEW